MAYCENCGAVLGAGAKYCGTCGREASEGGAPEAGTRRDAGTPRTSRLIRPDRLDKIVVLIVGVALLLAVLWFLFQFFLGFLSGFVSGLFGI